MPLPPLEELKSRVEAALPGVRLDLLPNGAVPAQSSLLVAPADAPAVAKFLRDDPQLRLEMCSNVTGVDWPERDEKVKVKKLVDGVEKEVEEVRHHPGFQEAVYHLFSVSLKHGPVVLRQRTVNRGDDCSVTSLTPVWRGCEFQEREAYDLFGLRFTGHPDLRRILMWDEFKDHPMRKDYVEPDDYEYEPTPHDEVHDRSKAHYPVPEVKA
jgi:NADH-quinone oxidoreductase subunit C